MDAAIAKIFFREYFFCKVTAHTVLVVFLVFFALDWGWDVTLTLLNLGHARKNANAVPAAFAGTVDSGTHSRSVQYTLTHGTFGLVSGAASSAALLVVILTGFLGYLDTLARGLHVHPYLQGILFLASVSFLFGVVRFPFSVYSTFVVEARFGFNRTTPRLFVIDMLKGLAVSAVIGIPVLLVLFWFMDRTGPLWWVWAFAAMTAFQLVMSVLTPLVIAPLFNKFTPLPDGSLKDRIIELASRLEFRTRGIFVVDSSKRSRHSNAYFTGLGRAKRIVLFDTLVSSHTEEEIVSVLAHEIGHEKRHHVRKGLVDLRRRVAGRVLDPEPAPALDAAVHGIRVCPARVPRAAGAPRLLLAALHLLAAASPVPPIEEPGIRGGPVRGEGSGVRRRDEVRAPAVEQGQPVQPVAAPAVQFLPLFSPDPGGANRRAGPGGEGPAGMNA